MSAYICEKHHITYLVSAAMSRSITRNYGFSYYHNDHRHALPPGDYAAAADLANMLWLENIKSVSHRYPGESSATLPGPIEAESVIESRDFSHWHWDRFDPVQVLKSIACYGYQSCEHPGWEESAAHAFCEALKSHCINSLPGYDAAVWGAPEKSSTRTVSLSSLRRR